MTDPAAAPKPESKQSAWLWQFRRDVSLIRLDRIITAMGKKP